jgi:hypothetical protein
MSASARAAGPRGGLRGARGPRPRQAQQHRPPGRPVKAAGRGGSHLAAAHDGGRLLELEHALHQQVLHQLAVRRRVLGDLAHARARLMHHGLRAAGVGRVGGRAVVVRRPLVAGRGPRRARRAAQRAALRRGLAAPPAGRRTWIAASRAASTFRRMSLSVFEYSLRPAGGRADGRERVRAAAVTCNRRHACSVQQRARGHARSRAPRGGKAPPPPPGRRGAHLLFDVDLALPPLVLLPDLGLLLLQQLQLF